MDDTPSVSGRRPDPDGMQDAAPPASRGGGIALPVHDVRRLLAWLVRIRWVFLLGLGAAVLAGATVLHSAFPVSRVVAVGAFVLAYNGALLLYHRTRRSAPTSRSLQLEAGLQIGLDLLALTALVHLTGGASSPFVILYVIHAIAGSMLLPRNLAWAVGAVAFALLLLVTVLEYEPFLRQLRPEPFDEIGWLRHRSLRVAIAIAFLVAIATATTITSSIMSSLRQVDARLLEKQAQLVQAEKQASLGRLVAGIAHEINNPIQFIRGNMAVLTEAFADVLPILDRHHATRPDLQVARLDYPFFRSQMPVLLQDMTDGAERIGTIVSDLKTYAHPDEGRLDEEVDLGETVRSSVRLLHNDLKRFRVEQQLDPSRPHVRGNPTQLQQLVVNILQNACQALGDDPGGRIDIRTRREAGGGWWRVSVRDTGCGIPASVRSRIFDPFFTTKKRTEGTGLGLAIAREIVERHHGRIEVESRVGSGTTFHVLLPAEGSGNP
jgi:signal transduction histidine kinase